MSRTGGDEFVVLLAEAEQVADAAIIATRMLEAVAEVHMVGGHKLYVSTSIGVAVFPGDGVDADDAHPERRFRHVSREGSGPLRLPVLRRGDGDRAGGPR